MFCCCDKYLRKIGIRLIVLQLASLDGPEMDLKFILGAMTEEAAELMMGRKQIG